LKYDRARIQLGKISRFGLMELSRQRLRPALAESAHIPCPRCHGVGHIRGTESTALHILRILQEEAMKDNTAQVVAQVPVDVATFLLNEKRNDVLTVETRFKVNVLLVPNKHLETPNFTVERLRHDELNHNEPLPMSFDMVTRPEEIDPIKAKKEEAAEPRQEPVVKGIAPAQPAPMPVERPAAPVAAPVAPAGNAGGWFDKMLSLFRAKPVEAAPPAAAAPAPKPERRESRDNRGRDGRRGGNGGARRDERRPGEARDGDSRRSPKDRDARPPQQAGERDARREPRQDGPREERRDGERGPRKDQRERRDGRRDSARDAQGAPAADGIDAQRPPRDDKPAKRPPRPPQKMQNGVDGEAAAITAPTLGAGGEHDERTEGQRRRRRRGRGGSDRADRPHNGAAAHELDAGASEHEHDAAVAAPATDATNVQDAGATRSHRDTPANDRDGNVARGEDRHREERESAVPPRQDASDPDVAFPVNTAREEREAARSVKAPVVHAPGTQLPLSELAPAAVPKPEVAAPVKVPAAPAAEAPRESVAPAIAATPVATATPAMQPSTPAPRRVEPVAAQPHAFEPVTLALPPGSGLELVETRHAALPAAADDEADAPRPKRVRRPRVEIASEPLQMVETHKNAPPSE
jgi:ribonuclease E